MGRVALIGMVCLLAFAPARAGTLYRCDSPDGSRSYTSKRIAGAQCEVISRYKPDRAARSASPAVSRAATSAPAATPAAAAAPPPASAASARSASSWTTSGGRQRRLVQGQVFAYEKDGIRHYTSRRPAAGEASALRTIAYSFMETCYACGALPGVNFGRVRLNTDAFRDEITAASRQHGVDEAVVRAIIHAESSFNPNAISRVGAQGLMQLMPATARRFGVTDAFEPAQNIRGGVQYLAWLLKRFKGDLTLAAAGYNAGEGAVDRYRGVPPYSETQRYVQRVAMLAERYRGVTGAAN